MRKLINWVVSLFTRKNKEPQVIMRRCNGAGVNEAHYTSTDNFHKKYDSKDGLQGHCIDCGKVYKQYEKSRREIHGRSERSEEDIIVDVAISEITEKQETKLKPNAEEQVLRKRPSNRHFYESMHISKLYQTYSRMRKEHGDDSYEAKKVRDYLKKRSSVFFLTVYDLGKRESSYSNISSEKILKLMSVASGETITASFVLDNTNVDLTPKRVPRETALTSMKRIQGYFSSKGKELV